MEISTKNLLVAGLLVGLGGVAGGFMLGRRRLTLPQARGSVFWVGLVGGKGRGRGEQEEIVQQEPIVVIDAEARETLIRSGSEVMGGRAGQRELDLGELHGAGLKTVGVKLDGVGLVGITQRGNERPSSDDFWGNMRPNFILEANPGKSWREAETKKAHARLLKYLREKVRLGVLADGGTFRSFPIWQGTGWSNLPEKGLFGMGDTETRSKGKQ